MKFKLIAYEDNHEAGDNKICHEFISCDLSVTLERLEIFLKAAGFCYSGELNIYDEGLSATPARTQSQDE